MQCSYSFKSCSEMQVSIYMQSSQKRADVFGEAIFLESKTISPTTVGSTQQTFQQVGKLFGVLTYC